MKLKTLSATAALIVGAWTYYAVSQQADEDVSEPEPLFIPPPDGQIEAKPEPLYAVSSETWMISDLNNPDADLSSLNTDELRTERYKAALACVDFAEYERQFPPTPEQLAQREESRRIMENPPTAEEAVAALTPEEQEERTKALEQLLNPQPPAQEE